MSGGRFDYKQYELGRIADEIQDELNKMGKEIPESEKSYYCSDYYEDYSKQTKDAFQKAILLLRESEIYVQRIDWLLSGDDGEESFLKRIKNDLRKLNNKY